MHLSTYSNTTISIITNIWKLPISFRPIPVYHPPRIGQLIQFRKKNEKIWEWLSRKCSLKTIFLPFSPRPVTRVEYKLLKYPHWRVPPDNEIWVQPDGFILRKLLTFTVVSCCVDDARHFELSRLLLKIELKMKNIWKLTRRKYWHKQLRR